MLGNASIFFKGAAGRREDSNGVGGGRYLRRSRGPSEGTLVLPPEMREERGNLSVRTITDHDLGFGVQGDTDNHRDFI